MISSECPIHDQDRETVPDVDVVVVDWNSGGLCARCVDSVLRSEREGFELRRITVVDNASSDGSIAALAPQWPQVDYLRNKYNQGYGRACNRGARRGSARYVLFLNPDIELFPDTLGTALAWMEDSERRDIGICGVRMLDANDSPQSSCFRFPTPLNLLGVVLGLHRLLGPRFREPKMTEWAHDEDRKVDQILGAFFLVRREVFAELGGFDEQFFLYYEEVDFSLRARRAGWASAFCARAEARHAGGASSARVPGARLLEFQRSRLLYARLHFGRVARAVLLTATLGVEPWARSAQAFLRRSGTDFRAAWYAWKGFCAWHFRGIWAPPGQSSDSSEEEVRVVQIVSRVVIGGPARHAMLLSSVLNRNEFRTILVGGAALDHERCLLSEIGRSGVSVRRLDRMSRSIRLFNDARSLLDLTLLLRRERPHVVHTHTSKAGAVGRLAARLAGVPVVFHTFHGHVFEGYFDPIRSRLAVWTERWLARRTTGIVVISDSQRHDLVERYRIASDDRVHIVPLGFDWESFFSRRDPLALREHHGIPRHRFLVGFIGRLVPVKNPALMVEIARLLQDWKPDQFHFVVVGDGDLRPEIERSIRELELSESFTFTGWQEVDHRLYRALDLVLCTSSNEGTPSALIEALAAGTPTLSRRVGGVADVFAAAGVDGALDSDRAEDFAAVIQEHAGRTVVPDAVRQRVQNHWAGARMTQQIRDLYLRALGKSVDDESAADASQGPRISEGADPC